MQLGQEHWPDPFLGHKGLLSGGQCGPCPVTDRPSLESQSEGRQDGDAKVPASQSWLPVPSFPSLLSVFPFLQHPFYLPPFPPSVTSLAKDPRSVEGSHCMVFFFSHPSGSSESPSLLQNCHGQFSVRTLTFGYCQLEPRLVLCGTSSGNHVSLFGVGKEGWTSRLHLFFPLPCVPQNGGYRDPLALLISSQ